MTTEDPVQDRARLLASQSGIWLMRNNSGVAFDNRGVPIRFGLMNDSAKVNDKIKSSDLIGVTPLLIQPHHVGTIVGVFTAIECKRPNWRLLPSDKRGEAQLKFHDLVRMNGGFAGFLSDPAQLMGIVGR